MAATLPPGESREECDQACATAMVNLGEFARMAEVEDGGMGQVRRGDVAGEGEARRWFEDAKRFSKKIGFEVGVRRAEEGLKSLGANT